MNNAVDNSRVVSRATTWRSSPVAHGIAAAQAGRDERIEMSTRSLSVDEESTSCPRWAERRIIALLHTGGARWAERSSTPTAAGRVTPISAPVVDVAGDAAAGDGCACAAASSARRDYRITRPDDGDDAPDLTALIEYDPCGIRAALAGPAETTARAAVPAPFDKHSTKE